MLLSDHVHTEIIRLAQAAYENYGLTAFQRDAVENLMYRAANAVLVEQARQTEEIARQVMVRGEQRNMEEFEEAMKFVKSYNGVGFPDKKGEKP
jgi:tRNA1(Val) A37 N6-methylase TrmN6